MRGLLVFGVVMPVVYLVALAAGVLLFPGYEPLSQPPSVLGGPDAPQPLPFNAGLVLTAAAGCLAALGLLASLPALGRGRVLTALGVLTGLALLIGSASFGMAGAFPLPDPRHYGFGLPILAALTPLLGALALLRAGGAAIEALALLGAFALILALVLLGGPPLAAGVAMLGAIALLCWTVRGRLPG